MASLEPKDKVRLAENLLVTMSGNPEALARIYLREAQTVTSTLPRPQLEKELAAELGQVVSKYSTDFKTLSFELNRVAEAKGVWPNPQGVWLNKTLLTVRNLVDSGVADELMRFMVSQVMRALGEMVVKAPAQSRESLINVAQAIGKNPGHFASSVVNLMELHPQDFRGLPPALVREVYALAELPLIADEEWR
jgi:hypothetical protein